MFWNDWGYFVYIYDVFGWFLVWWFEYNFEFFGWDVDGVEEGGDGVVVKFGLVYY